jgi:hypothetical protein
MARISASAWLAGFVLAFAMTTQATAQTAPPPATPPVLPSLAVSEVRTAPGTSLPSYYSAYTLTREVEAALDATRKFRVVSRSSGEAEAMADELQATKRRNMAAQSATFVVAIEVLGVDLRREQQPIPNMYGKYRVQSVGRVEMRVSLRKTADGSIQSRFPIEARVSTPAEVFDGHNLPTAAASSLGFVDLAKGVGKRVADRVLDELYPVLVIQRQGSIVYLNRGEDSGYRIGETLRVFSGGGERLRDPYTGEDLGPLETQLGTIRVTDQRPRVTMAEVVNETGTIGQGAIVRKAVERER